MTDEIDFSRLSPAERILLAEDLWDSLAASQETPPLTSTQLEELERRLAAADRGATAYSSWDKVKRRLLRKE